MSKNGLVGLKFIVRCMEMVVYRKGCSCDPAAHRPETLAERSGPVTEMFSVCIGLLFFIMFTNLSRV